jgi:nickel/cobalt exporter
MPDFDLLPLLALAVGLGVVHTVLGPDHYIPFVALARSRRWSLRRTLAVTSLCGVGHVLGSVGVGLLGITLGWALGSVEAFEGSRGQLAGWLLLGFGCAYLLWGLRIGLRARRPGVLHRHGDVLHTHAHAHPHRGRPAQDSMTLGGLTPWVLFLIFVFGPCEVLIPLLMVPAAEHSGAAIALVAATFGVATIATMLTIVALGYLGLGRFAALDADRWVHAISGLAVGACGALILVGF